MRLRAAVRGESFWAVALLIAAVILVDHQASLARVQDVLTLHRAVGQIARTGIAAVALFGLSGYGAARLLLPLDWRPYECLFFWPIGAACSTLALTVLGLAHVPLGVSLPLVLAGGLALSAFAVLRGRRAPEPLPADRASRLVRIVVPLGLALVVGTVTLLPTLRAGFATVQGQNGDAILAVGTGDFLRHAPPTSVRPELGLDRVPIQWRSKLPIYYGLAAVSELAGQSTIMALSPLAACVAAMFALGIFLLLACGLRGPPLAALAAAFLVGLDRIVVYVSMHTYYNQLWAMMALPFVLLFAWRFLRDPNRRSAILAGLFTALALFTYPLLLPFPAVFLAVIAWRERARAREWAGSVRLPRWAYVVALVVAVPVAAVLVRGIVEKLVPALDALRPGGDLSGWAGGEVLPYLPVGRFVGLESSSVPIEVLLLALVTGGAVVALRRCARDISVGLGVLLAGALLSGLYLRARGQGELFWFKDLGFAGPLILALAVLGLARLGRGRALRAAGLAAIALITVGLMHGTRREVAQTYELGSHDVLEIADWDKAIPTSETIRIDIGPGSWQLWGWYLLARHRVSASDPQGGFFPHPPYGLKADLALEMGTRPPDAVGPPIYANGAFAIYRIRGGPGPDTSSQALKFDVTKITY